jgi:long-chain acyl-CoA synthetase
MRISPLLAALVVGRAQRVSASTDIELDIEAIVSVPNNNEAESDDGSDETGDGDLEMDRVLEEMSMRNEEPLSISDLSETRATESPVYRSALLGPDGQLMNEPKNFNGHSTYDLFLAGMRKSGKKQKSFGFFEKGKYKWLTYKQMDWHVKALGMGIVRMGLHGLVTIDGQDWRMLAIYSEHRLGWTMTELAAAYQNVTLVPLYETSNPDFVKSILKQTQVSTVVASTPNAAKLLRLFHESSAGLNLRTIVLLGTEREREELIYQFHDVRISIKLMKEVKIKGTKGVTRALTSPADVNTICFTSGTTGEPKGVLITNAMLLSVVGAASELGLGLSPKDKFFAFLPPAHIFERVLDLTMMFTGARIGYYAGDKLQLARDIRLVRPSIMAGVPRSLEKTLEKIEAKLRTKSKPLQWAASKALKNSDYVMNSVDSINHNLFFLNTFAIRRIRKNLGGKLRLIMSGGGPLSAESQAKLKQYLHVYVVQGYGLTETTGGTLIQSPLSRTYGIVGVPVPCAEVKLVDKHVHAPIAEGAGELLVRGPSVFAGYFRRPDLNAEIFTEDGWFRTGDVATVVNDENGRPRFKIVGRSKEIFKLPNGEYVVPALLENMYKTFPAVDEIFIDLSPSKETIVALVNVKPSHLTLYFENPSVSLNGDDATVTRLLNAADLGLADDILQAFNLIAKSEKLVQTSWVSKVYVSPTLFGPETPYQTVTMKPKRALIRELLAETIKSVEST